MGAPRLTPPAQSSLSAGRLTEAAADALLGADRPARLQMIAALVLGLVLVAIPLYLWRRPRSEAVTVASEASTAPSGSAVSLSGAPPIGSTGQGITGAAPSTSDAVLLSEARVLECHDPGSKHTPATECDHLVVVEKALAQAIESSASCLPTSAGGGTLVYVADVSFQRKRNPFAIALPKDGRNLKNPRASAASASACGSAVKRAVSGVVLDGLPHLHARYKIAITASYPSK